MRYQQAAKSLTLFARQISESETINKEYGERLRAAIVRAHEANNHDSFLRRFLVNHGLAEPRNRPPPPTDQAPS
jgi:hypothetical protein